MPEIKRYISERKFDNFKKDISPLVKKIRESMGELNFQLRKDDLFNIYYKGNSLAEVKVQRQYYVVSIHEKFKAPKAAEKRFPKNRFNNPKRKKKNYDSIFLKPEELSIFFQVSIIKALAARIKSINYGEEITFEQSLISDNLDSEDIIIIDRQVGGGGISGFLDLLALKKVARAKYRFVVLEVKLGNNKELDGEVVSQIEKYIEAIKENINNFRECYQINYAQKKELGLFPMDFPDEISIDNEVEGRIVVGLYSKIGEEYINNLLRKYPDWKSKIIHFRNELKL